MPSAFSEKFNNFLSTLPNLPGVYQFFDNESNILYVGKAKDLKKRVSSYFAKNIDSAKTRILVAKINKIEFTVVDTEQDAFLLENVLIKKLQPRYNILLKDDKTYPYICINNENFPRIYITRKVIKNGSTYFGPYTSGGQVFTLLETIKKLFQIRTCNLLLTPKTINEQKFKVCLEYHIGNCKAPCVAKQTESDYMQTIEQIKNILKGHTSSVINFLKTEMQKYAEEYEFEKAQLIKQKLVLLADYQSKSTIVNPLISNIDVFAIENDEKSAFISFLKIVNGAIIQSKVAEVQKKLDEPINEVLVFAINEMRATLNSNSTEIIVPLKIQIPIEPELKIVVPLRGDKKKLLELAQKNAYYYKKQAAMKASLYKRPEERKFEVLQQLKKDLRLTEVPIHIECFDNSNFQGNFAVASMVVFKNGNAAKKEYRHYNVKTVQGPNDFASMEEIVYRRYKRIIDEAANLPQLILIDGGKGQLSAAINSLKKLNLIGKVAIVGIAKKLEELYLPNDPYPLHIDKRSESLKLIQQIRNEAHRFAITFHRQKRSKGTFKSELEKVNGIGEKTIEKLLTHYQSIENIKKAEIEDLVTVLDAKKARNVFDYFH